MENSILEKAKIFRLLVISLILGLVVLVAAVMPAEYGVDPLGVGKALGFNKLYVDETAPTEIPKEKVVEVKKYPFITMEEAGSKPEVPVPAEANNPAPKRQFIQREDMVEVIIPAGKGIEYKIDVLKYGKVKYEWSTGDHTVFFDFHGEVKEKNPVHPVFYESYTVAYSNNMVGTFTSPFEGKHGWYFKNLGEKDIVVKIRLKGQYKLR